MQLKQIGWLLGLAATVVTAAPTVGRAQVANGTTGSFSYLFPNQGSTLFGPVAFTVGDGVEGTFNVGNIPFTIDVNAAAQTLTLTANDSGCCTSGATFSGWLIQFNQAVLGGAGTVSLLQTNIFNFGAERISNTASSIAISFGNFLDLRNNRSLVLQLSSPTPVPVPEPHSAALVVVGLSALGVVTRRRRRA